MTTFELAKQYYPRLWNRERIEALAGPEETETLWFQRGEPEAALRLSGFREGFRLGASLLLALHP